MNMLHNLQLKLYTLKLKIYVYIVYCFPGPSTKANCRWYTGPKTHKHGDRSECICWMLVIK